MQGFSEFLKTLGVARIIAMGLVAIALMAFFAYIILRVTAPTMTTLFTDLSMEDSSAIVKDLERQGISYEIRNDGATVSVPRDKVARLRMKLAEIGLPKGAGVGYEIFDKSDALGATSFVQNINHLRALEGELSRTIRAIDRVQAARVHLVIPERPLFARDKAEPSASIVLRVRGALETAQVRAIRHLVASAVNGLKPARVSVVDENGRLLADGAQEDASGSATGDERKLAFERHMREQVESIVSSIVGPGRSRVQVTADFDFNRITQTSDRFDPESRVVRSSQTREETAASADGREGQVTVGNEIPGGRAAPGQNAGQDNTVRNDNSRKSEEIVNYEISRVTKTEVIEGGRLSRVSVAVLVDGNYTKNDKGESAYTPRDKEELDRIAALVRSSIGFDQKRGDQVEVVNLRMAESQQNLINEPKGWLDALQWTKDDIIRGIEMAVMVVLGLVVLLLVVRPFLRRVLATPERTAIGNSSAQLPSAATAAVAGPAGVAAIAGSNAVTGTNSPNVIVGGDPATATISTQTSQMIDIAQVQGQVHAQSIQKVGELADKNPQETVAIIRSWLYEAA